MSTELLTMQSFPAPRYREPELDLKMASEISNLYNTQDGWAFSPPGNESRITSANYMRFIVPRTSKADGRLEQKLGYEQEVECSKETSPNERIPPPAYTDIGIRLDYSTASNTTTSTSPSAFGTTSIYTEPSMFTATNALAPSQDTTTISPLQTHVDLEETSPRSEGSFSFDTLPRAPMSTNFIEYTTNEQQIPGRQSSGSSQISPDHYPPSQKHSGTGRRRRSEFAVVGSARAIYLEKNRKAASKCRSKQKRQQENLVEEARDVERINRALKAEVEMLKSGMRELMDIVGQHTHCSDSRLKQYVQREADRLATGCMHTSFRSQSSKSSSSSHGFLLLETIASPNSF